MIAAAGSPLVSGARAAPQQIRVRALRAFLHKGKRVEPGAELDLPRSLGVELVTGNKAEVVVDAAKPAPAPAAGDADTTKPAKAATKQQGKQP